MSKTKVHGTVYKLIDQRSRPYSRDFQHPMVLLQNIFWKEPALIKTISPSLNPLSCTYRGQKGGEWRSEKVGTKQADTNDASRTLLEWGSKYLNKQLCATWNKRED
jgi:hypothetical protein